MYTIRIMNCAFFAHHGVFDEENKLGQRFYVDAILDVDAGSSLENDDIEGTVHYGIAFTVIQDIITGRQRYLIETLALDVGKALTERFPQIKRAEITIRKPNAPVPGVLDHVEVTVVYPR
ncbi:dihydroneopterin aldolase [Brucella pseudogrignonensis]|uniref:dihydroneopterin aldolase n=1 Tax=Brucella TaxID=234 RepID=UPI00201FDB99|nr:dihydroneopterin aldolase [Brucella pseudogrignonensis]MCL7998178.1 dihydroneopterin aldolase [Brucella sp. 21LCYQ03]MDT6938679.1 dihydroneopterin aldolase [Brucella pseudogrignonensis]